MTYSPPLHPAGAPPSPLQFDQTLKNDLIKIIEQAPLLLKNAVAGFDDSQLDTLYKNWTIRQIVHHLPESHLHSFIRFKWTLTEENPTIKAYEETDWAQLADNLNGDVQPSLLLMEGLHLKWVQSLKSMTDAQFARTFHHPQTHESVSLWAALNYYAWHCQHHTAQIAWLRNHYSW